MEEINWLRVFAGLLLVLFIPGYTFIQALFPRKGELDEEFDSDMVEHLSCQSHWVCALF